LFLSKKLTKQTGYENNPDLSPYSKEQRAEAGEKSTGFLAHGLPARAMAATERQPDPNPPHRRTQAQPAILSTMQPPPAPAGLRPGLTLNTFSMRLS